jgi:hypothetical protein
MTVIFKSEEVIEGYGLTVRIQSGLSKTMAGSRLLKMALDLLELHEAELVTGQLSVAQRAWSAAEAARDYEEQAKKTEPKAELDLVREEAGKLKPKAEEPKKPKAEEPKKPKALNGADTKSRLLGAAAAATLPAKKARKKRRPAQGSSISPAPEDVECPFCEAVSGQLCLTRTGYEKDDFHHQRLLHAATA